LPFIPTTRRQFFLRAAGVATLALAGDSLLLEPNRPRIVRRDFFLPRWPQALSGFTIALLSDFHYDPYFSVHPLHATIPLVNGLHPDLIVLTGDFVSVPEFGDERKAAFAAEPCTRLLCQLTAPLGLWAVLGNHDDNTDPQHVTRALEAENIRVLANQSVPIERGGGRFWLAGVNDVIGGTADLTATLRNVPRDEAVVLLAHEPDFADEAADFPSTCSSPGTPMEARSGCRSCHHSTYQKWPGSMSWELTGSAHSRSTPMPAWAPLRFQCG
jgi:predicted MPP superfamily phosphohydrolase